MSRRERILLALASNAGQGLPLRSVVDLIGEGGRRAERVTVTMLRSLRREGLVGYVPAVERIENGRPAGHYFGTQMGRRYLQSRGHSIAAAADAEGSLETGAMRGERPEILRRPAIDGAAPRGAIASVWDLARADRTAQEPRQALPAPLLAS